METTLNVPEVHCDHCVSSIEGALTPMDGVEGASVDLETTSVTVAWDPDVVTLDDIVTAIDQQGYTVSAN